MVHKNVHMSRMIEDRINTEAQGNEKDFSRGTNGSVVDFGCVDRLSVDGYAYAASCSRPGR